MNNKGYIASTSVFATMLIVSILIFTLYIPIVNNVVSVKEGGEKVLAAIEERNALERAHAEVHVNPMETGTIQYEDLNLEVEITQNQINILRNGRTVRTIKRN